jgi:membrane-bound metal-dependent hydrolase YbcI (DUF457 family)
MDSLFHFLFSLIAVFAARIHIKHGIPTLLLLAVISVFVDVDHFIGMPRAGFHNLFVTLLFPIILIIFAFRFGREYHRQVSIALLLFLFSHTILDLFMEGKVALFYPLTLQTFSINFSFYALGRYMLISSNSIGLVIYFCVILLCFFLEEIDSFILKKHEGFKEAIRDVFSRKKIVIN